MATYTEKYNLKKPDETDFIDIADINENMDKIDKTLDNVKQTVIPISERAVANGVATLDENGKIPAEQLSAVGILPRLDVTAANGVTVTVTDGTTILSEISTGTVSFNLPNFGDWRIEAGSYIKTVEIDTVKIYKITALALNDASWEQIAEISESGKAMDIWALGDEKNITVAGEELTLVIVDFDHDDKSDNSGKAGLTFGLKNLMTNNRSISGLSSNANGFTGTNTYSWLHSELFLNFPVDLQNVIKSVDKKTSIGNMNTDIIVDSMKVFLFSEIEIFGEVT
ncbi:MAG: hypothetical protein K2G22_07345, partial [Eubacterium sp.]|nr:hypothetical protein [Eubacterium sp.]